jgi:predicted DNA-binding protein
MKGRPGRPRGARYVPIAGARVTPEMRQRLEALAARERRPLSYYLRAALAQYLEQLDKEERDVRA